MSEPNLFRHYLIVQDAEGNNVELVRTAEQVAVLAFDTIRLEYVHCHVLLEPLTERAIFEDTCRRLRGHGHPLLARLVDFGEDEGNPYYITGNVDGEPLSAYLGRQKELPAWMAVMLASRALEAAAELCERGDYLTAVPVESLRVVQVSPQAMVVIAADYRLTPGEAKTAAKSRALRSTFEKQGKFLKAFLMEQCGEGPTLADQMVEAADYAELLGGCLQAANPATVTQMMELRNGLQKLAPEELSGEIPAGQKPRALLAPLLATYQEVARGVVNQVRIQSQRLDMNHPYSMRGTLTKAGRAVLVEQVPPVQAGGQRVLEVDRQVFRLSKKREFSSLATLALVQESEAIVCMAEEIVEGVSLADLLRERGALEVQEAYLVLAGLDAALTQLDDSGIPCRKLRLEDLFLLIGGERSDPRSTRMLSTKLNDWPSFSLLVRAHPCLSGMVCRGTDPGLLLPPGPTTSAEVTTLWHGGWLAAVGRFLLGLETVLGGSGSRAAAVPTGRERETVERLLEDELQKNLDGKPSARAAFLSRFARIVHHYDLVKPIPGVTEIPPVAEPERGKVKIKPRVDRRPREPEPEAEAVPVERSLNLGSLSLVEPKEKDKDKPTVGFAEILFQGRDEPTPPETPDWARKELLAGRTLPVEAVMAGDEPPLWLKLAVFVLGSMVVGGFVAHQSGSAIWQRVRGVEEVIPRAVEVGDEEMVPADLEMLKPAAGNLFMEPMGSPDGGSATTVQGEGGVNPLKGPSLKDQLGE